MPDEDFAGFIRRSDPARTPIATPLSLRAEADLARLMSAEGVEDSLPAHRKRSSARWFILPVVAFVLLVFAIVAQNIVPTPNAIQTAQAATPALLVGSGERLGIDVVMDKAIASLTAGSVKTSARGTQYEAWSLDTEVDANRTAVSSIVPQRLRIRWSADLSGRITIASGAPYLANGSPAAPPSGTMNDEVTTEYRPGEMGILFPDPPPTSPEAMAEYLTAGTGREITDPVQLVNAIAELQNEWRLGTKERIAILQLLSRSNVSPLGRVTDRLGREGYGFEATSETDAIWKAVFVISSDTGAVLSVEQIYNGGLPELDVTPPAVTSYTAWK